MIPKQQSTKDWPTSRHSCNIDTNDCARCQDALKKFCLRMHGESLPLWEGMGKRLDQDRAQTAPQNSRTTF